MQKVSLSQPIAKMCCSASFAMMKHVIAFMSVSRRSFERTLAFRPDLLSTTHSFKKVCEVLNPYLYKYFQKLLHIILQELLCKKTLK